tara:strand:+ start:2107 stop:2313 length:207 start_codon:yes stop_codon:yes gene_type:complete
MICKFVIEIPKEDKEERAKFIVALGDVREMVDENKIRAIEDLIVFLEGKGLRFPVYFEAIENLEEEDD